MLTQLYEAFTDEKASLKDIIRFLVIKEFEAHQFTKLDQAGSESDTRPGVHKLFVDLPFRSESHRFEGFVAEELLRAAGKNHRDRNEREGGTWQRWRTFPARARIWFVQRGPGQGKTTSGQYFSQLQRAALILDWDGDAIPIKCSEAAADIQKEAEARNHWSDIPRIPINIELRDYAQWFGAQVADAPRGILPYLAQRISTYVDKTVLPATIKRALRSQRWFVVFDGLDEVPNDVKDALAARVKDFINDTTIECDTDVAGGDNKCDVLICEVKSEKDNKPNPVWRHASTHVDMVQYIVRFCGILPEDSVFAEACRELSRKLFNGKRTRIRYAIFAQTPSKNHAKRGVTYVTFRSMVEFLVSIRGQSWTGAKLGVASRHQQWPEFVKRIFDIANYNNDSIEEKIAAVELLLGINVGPSLNP